MTKVNYSELYQELIRESHKALAECPAPTPIIVGSPSTPLGNDVDPNQQRWFHADGLCGFANVVIENGRLGFAQWLVKNDKGRKWWSYGRYKGVSVDTFSRYGFAHIGQSYEKNSYVANRIAGVLRANGIDAWVDARLD